MITNIEAEHLFVISDLHIGNPYARNCHNIVKFMNWAADQGGSLCINGDGLDFAQSSIARMLTDVPEFISALAEFNKRGKRTYYTIGNHDIILENAMTKAGLITIVPFLNVKSGNKRVRIEHGHLYDPIYIFSPAIYEKLSYFFGVFIRLWPDLFGVWIQIEKLIGKLYRYPPGAIRGENPNFTNSAYNILERGFDHVVFGHTHVVGEVDMGDGKSYLNPGGWMTGHHFVEIKDGVVQLAKF